MWLQHLYQRFVNRPCTRRQVRPQAPRRRGVRVGLEILEDRLTPSNFTAATVSDLIADINAANLAGGSNTIALVGGKSFTLTAVDNATDGPTGLPVIAANDNLTIAGNGDTIARSTDAGTPAFRLFDVASGAALTLKDLTIADGLANQGGGIANAGNLTLSNSNLFGNQAVGGLGGGGIFNESNASLTLKSSVLLGNQATSAAAGDVFGGGLLNEGSATIDSSTFSGNQALGGASSNLFFGGSAGGAIDNHAGAALTVTNSTFTNNQALGAGGFYYGLGGAINNNSGPDNTAPSTATIDNSIFVGNLAGGDPGATGNGGAILNEGTETNMTLSNSMFIGNRSVGQPGNGSPGGGVGGAILNWYGSTLTIRNSALAGNQAIGGNSASAVGGAIDNSTGATLYLINSTLYSN